MPEYTPDKEMQAKLSIVEPFSKYAKEADKLWGEYGTTSRYKTGWKAFDTWLGGGFGSEHRGELVVIAADTGVGKSTFLANIAINVTRLAGERLHYMSLENPPEDVYNAMRFIQGTDKLGETEKYFTSASKELLFGNGAKAWQAEDLLLHMEYVVKAHGTKLFILDHLNFMFENEEQLQNEHLRTRVIMRKLSRFAMHNKVCIFVVSHINKRTDGSKKLSMERIYGSGSIAGAATKVLVLQERTEMAEWGEVRLIDVFYLKSRFTAKQKDTKAVFNASTPMWEFENIIGG